MRGDAFDALARVLALRSERRRAAGAKEKVEAKFCEDELPSHLLDRGPAGAREYVVVLSVGTR